MGTALIPLSIVFGGILSAVLLFTAAWRPLSERLRAVGKPFARELDLSGLAIGPDELGFVLIALVAGFWLTAVILTQPGPLLGAGLLLALAAAMFLGTRVLLRIAVARNIRRFNAQLENVLRMFAGAVRVGLGVRQALTHVAEQSDEPARRELTRVIGSANLGVPITDALDGLAARMALPETRMLARVIRVQSQTGSDLASVLDGLADTIRDRRRFARKVRALTSQGRATAWLLGALPLAIGLFVLTTQPHLRDVTLGTTVGRGGLALSLAFDAVATVVLLFITRIDA